MPAGDERGGEAKPVGFVLIFTFVVLLLGGALAALFLASGDWAWAIGLIFLAYDACLLSALIFLSRRASRRSLPSNQPSTEALRLIVLVPARNEREVLPDCLDALLVQKAATIQVIDDGSSDGTVGMLADRYGVVMAGEHGRSTQYPDLRVWSKPSTGKAASFNQILPDCEEEIVVTVDADTVIAPGSLEAIRSAFARDASLVAGCGILRPKCRGKLKAAYFEFFQRFEYLRAFLWRLAWSDLNALALVSGAFAAYRRAELQSIGNFDPTSWVEDYELMYRFHQRSGELGLGWRVAVFPDARGVTDAPASPGLFLRQRGRWFGGFLSTFFAHRRMVGQRKYGNVGRRLLPLKTVDTLLPFFSSLSQISLIGLLVFEQHFPIAPLSALIIGKLIFDLSLHLWAVRIYARWLKLPLTPGLVGSSMLASLLEPVFFQPLRYLGALVGWSAYALRRQKWMPQRVPVFAAEER